MQSLRDGSRIVMKHDFIVTRIYIQYISCNPVPLSLNLQCGRNAVLLYTQPQCDRNAVLLYTQPQCDRNAVLLYTQPQCGRNAVLLYTLNLSVVMLYCYTLNLNCDRNTVHSTSVWS